MGHAFLPVGLLCASYIALIVGGTRAQVESTEETFSEAKHTLGLAVTFSLNNFVLASSSPSQPSSFTAMSVIGLLKTIVGFIASVVPEGGSFSKLGG